LRAIVDRSATDNLAAKRTPHHLSATEKVPMTDKILISDCIAIFLTPVAALWIGGILQRRSDGYLTSAGGPGAAVAVGRAQGVARGRVQRSACILVAIA
jgi:hypothetical protein